MRLGQGGTGLVRVPGRCEGSGHKLFHLPRIHTHTPPSFWEISLIFSATMVTVEASLTPDPRGSVQEWHQTQPEPTVLGSTQDPSPDIVFVLVLGIKPRAFCMLGKYSTSELHSPVKQIQVAFPFLCKVLHLRGKL